MAAEVESFMEYGYRLPDGTEAWATALDDTVATPENRERGIGQIFIWDSNGPAENAEKLREAGQPITRRVTITRGPVEDL